MNQGVKMIAVAAMPTISPGPRPSVDEHRQVIVGLAPQIQVSNGAVPHLEDESNHVGIRIIVSGGFALE